VNRLVTGKKLLQAKVTDVLKELRVSTVMLTEGLASRADYQMQEIEWISTLQAKTIKLLFHGKIVTNSLQKLLHGVQELNYGRLTQDLVPNETLRQTIRHVQQKIVTHENVSMFMISNDVRQLHKRAIIHHVHVLDHFIISMIIPLTANRNEFTCYKVIKHYVTVPNSDVCTILETEVEYIAIEKETMQYAYITELEAKSLQLNKDYLLRKKILINNDDNDCLTAIFVNNHTSIKK